MSESQIKRIERFRGKPSINKSYITNSTLLIVYFVCAILQSQNLRFRHSMLSESQIKRIKRFRRKSQMNKSYIINILFPLRNPPIPQICDSDNCNEHIFITLSKKGSTCSEVNSFSFQHSSSFYQRAEMDQI